MHDVINHARVKDPFKVQNKPMGFNVSENKNSLIVFRSHRATNFFLIFIFTLFYFTIPYWFCHTLTWIRHGCTWVPNPEPPSQLPPHIISLDHPRAPAPSILYPVLNIDWWFISYRDSIHVSVPFSQIIKSVLYNWVFISETYLWLFENTGWDNCSWEIVSECERLHLC